MQHKHNAGKNCLSITKFFGLVKAEEKTNATGSVLFMSRAILAPKNEHVDSVNNIIIDKMLGDGRIILIREPSLVYLRI